MKERKWKYPPKVLHLFLKHKWYDMIADGNKREEYRDIDKWGKRVCTFGRSKYCKDCCGDCGYMIGNKIFHTTIEKICFHRGYTNTTMLFEVLQIQLKNGNAEWGAPVDKKVISFILDKRLE